MENATRHIRFDEELQVEAYIFTGMAQIFPNHFHDYYVIGLIEVGERLLTVNRLEHRIGPGDMLTFNPLDNHACEQADAGTMSYRCINIKPDVMLSAAREVSGFEQPPSFDGPVCYRADIAPAFRELHECVMKGSSRLEKEEIFLLFMQQLLAENAQATERFSPPTVRREIEDVCSYLEEHYTERITLEMLGRIANLNKYSLLRTFTRWKGITPYRYLETIRINKAKELLERGVKVAEAAQLTGFADQSHFTGYFNKFIGLSPGQYQSIFHDE